jgi:hypothetical protein
MQRTSTPSTRQPVGRPTREQVAARNQAAAAAPVRKHPGRVLIRIAAGNSEEEETQFFSNSEDRILIKLGQAVWVRPWVIDVLRTAEIGVFVADPKDQNRKRTVLKRRFPFEILRDPDNLITPEPDDQDDGDGSAPDIED